MGEWIKKGLEKAVGMNKRRIWFIMIIGGILLLAIGWGDGGAKQQETAPKQDGQVYIRQLEDRLENTLSRVAGAGKVTVLLTPESQGRVSVARDRKQSDAQNGTASESSVVLAEGDAPVILEEYYPTVGGAVIIASGASTEEMCLKLRRAAAAALQIGINRIEVLEGSGKR